MPEKKVDNVICPINIKYSCALSLSNTQSYLKYRYFNIYRVNAKYRLEHYLI